MTQPTIEFERETDGRWICEYNLIPGAMAYGETPEEALIRVAEIVRDESNREGNRRAKGDKMKTKVRLIPQPEGGRVETGVVQFDGDWPGIFIRGDSALPLAFQLKSAIRLSELLDSCNAHKLRDEEDESMVPMTQTSSGDLPEPTGPFSFPGDTALREKP